MTPHEKQVPAHHLHNAPDSKEDARSTLFAQQIEPHLYLTPGFIGEVDYDAVITFPKCGRCANPFPEGGDKVLYIVNKFNKNP